VLSAAVAAPWVESWDEMMTQYAVGRAERARAVGDVVAGAVRGRAAPLVVDLGCGPGSLARVLAARLPSTEVLAVDDDPFLLALAGACAPPSVRCVRARIGAPGWVAAVSAVSRRSGASWDAVTAEAVLHYLRPEELARVYRDIAAVLAPGGVLVNADHLPSAPVPAGGPSPTAWSAWWHAATSHPDLAAAVAERPGDACPSADNGLTVREHRSLLRAAGFSRVATVWSMGPSRVLVAVR